LIKCQSAWQRPSTVFPTTRPCTARPQDGG